MSRAEVVRVAPDGGGRSVYGLGDVGPETPSMTSTTALLAERHGDEVQCRVAQLGEEDLGEGEVTVRVEYSASTTRTRWPPSTGAA